MMLAELDGSATSRAPVDPSELQERRALYRLWRDLSVLCLPDGARQLFDAELEEIEARVPREDRERLLKKPLRFPHGEGFERINRERSGALG
jgi:hypothetical protein